MGAPEPDPFAIFHQPPPGETAEERLERESREAQEKRVSDQIDEEIKLEKAALKKQKNVVKVLLLGQSESGKSTTLKNFRLKYARTAWKQERASWRAVIQLNLIRSILTILDTLQAEFDHDPLPLSLAAGYSSTSSSAPHSFLITRPSIDSGASYSGTDIDYVFEPPSTAPTPALTEKHQLLKLRLGPLRRVEADLKRRLGAGSDEIFDSGGLGVLGEQLSHSSPLASSSVARSRGEFGVRGWKTVLDGANVGKGGRRGENGSGGKAWVDEGAVDEVTEVLASCREDMMALWEDEVVKGVLKKRRMSVEDSPGFFLNDLDRVATRTYEPSDDDVVRARLRTLGMQEYRIRFEKKGGGVSAGGGFLENVGLSPDFGNEWVIYDVGGSRTSRKAWLPYFEGVNAIIFLAPISCFDERLLEDPSINRLEDSFLLWRAVCSSKLLSKTTMILFLNKCDLLKRKLKAGAQVRTFLPSYGERPNEAGAVVRYLKDKFKDILRQHSPEPRVSYFYPTSVTDTKATSTTLKTVRDSILREHLKSADFV